MANTNNFPGKCTVNHRVQDLMETRMQSFLNKQSDAAQKSLGIVACYMKRADTMTLSCQWGKRKKKHSRILYPIFNYTNTK